MPVHEVSRGAKEVHQRDPRAQAFQSAREPGLIARYQGGAYRGTIQPRKARHLLQKFSRESRGGAAEATQAGQRGLIATRRRRAPSARSLLPFLIASPAILKPVWVNLVTEPSSPAG